MKNNKVIKVAVLAISLFLNSGLLYSKYLTEYLTDNQCQWIIKALECSRNKVVGCNLKGADLRGSVSLFDADLKGADLTGALLAGADLRGVDLTGALLTGADLRGADLRFAYLKDANLKNALLTGTLLTSANFGSCKQSLIMYLLFPIKEDVCAFSEDELKRNLVEGMAVCGTVPYYSK